MRFRDSNYYIDERRIGIGQKPTKTIVLSSKCFIIGFALPNGGGIAHLAYLCLSVGSILNLLCNGFEVTAKAI